MTNLSSPAVWTFSSAFLHRPKGEHRIAQGFSPGNDTHNEIALKGGPNRVALDKNIFGSNARHSVALSGRLSSARIPRAKALGCSIFALRAMPRSLCILGAIGFLKAKNMLKMS
jgi:hypothetical protein